MREREPRVGRDERGEDEGVAKPARTHCKSMQLLGGAGEVKL